MTCRSAAAIESPTPDFSASGIIPRAVKVKNNFSIDHLLAKSDPVQSINDQVNRELVTEKSNFSFPPLDGANCGFTSPDSSCGNYNEDYLDNASEDPSEDSFDNGKKEQFVASQKIAKSVGKNFF